MYRLVIFDFDGTLADSSGWFFDAMNAAAPRFGYRAIDADELEMLRGLGNREILRRIGVRPWKLPAIARHMRAEAARGLHRIHLFPGARDSLAALAWAGVRLAIVSSNSEDNVRTVLGESAALISHFGCGASLFGKAAKFRQVIRHSGIQRSQVIAVGAEARDIEAARLAGVASGAVLWGYATRNALARAQPDMMFESFAGLVEGICRTAAARHADAATASTGSFQQPNGSRS